MAIFFVLGSLFSDVFFFPQLLQTGLHYDPLQAGLRLMVWTCTFILVASGVGALVDRIGERPLMVSGLLIQCGGTAWIAWIARPGLPFSHLVVPLIVAGVGISMAIPSAQNSVVGSATVESAGKLAGINSIMRELGGVFGIAVAVAVFAGFGGYGSARAFTNGFGPHPTRLCVVDLEDSIFCSSWMGDPSSFTGRPSRIEGIGRQRVEPSFLRDIVDHMIQVPDAASIATMRYMRERTGRSVGGSTGTNVWGAFLLVAEMLSLGERGSVVTLVCEGGDRYAGTYYSDEWVRDQGLALAPDTEALETFLASGAFPVSGSRR